MLSTPYLRLPVLYLIFLSLMINQEGISGRDNLVAHPHLFFTADNVASLQAKASASHAEIAAPILEYAQQMVGNLPPTAAPVDGSEETYRNFGNRLTPLAFACVLTQEHGLCDLAKQTLLRYANWNQWGEYNQRDLGLAHMVLGNAIAYDWLYGQLSATEQAQVQQALGHWSQLLYEASSADDYNEAWGNWWHNSYMQNYHWICNSALGMAGLALRNEDERADTWVNQAVTQLERVQLLLNGIGDGSWHEGVSYQDYALTMLLPFMANLEHIDGRNLFPESYLQNYVLWRVYNQLPNQFYPALAFGDFEQDWGNAYQSQNILRLIANRYHNGLAEWMAQELLKPEPRLANDWQTPWYVLEFLYYNPSILPTSPANLPLSRVFGDQESLIWRTGWDQDSLVFGFKSGVYGGRFGFNSFVQRQAPWDAACEETNCQLNIDHDHLDSNGFYLYQGGYWLAPESIGVNKRATAYHNSLLIDGQGQYAPATPLLYDQPEAFRGSDGNLEIISSVPDFDYLTATVTRRYKNIPDLQQVRRQVLFVRPTYFVMLDNVEASATHHYEWVSHFGSEVSLEGSWVRGGGGDDKLLGVAVVAPQQFTSTIGNDGQPFVHIAPAVDANRQRLIHLLYPTDVTHWSTKPLVQRLDNRPNWSAVRVARQDGSGRTDDILFNNGGNSGSGYGFNGNLALVSRENQQLVHLYLVEGDWLADQDGNRTLVQRTHAGQSLEATYKGDLLLLYGSSGGTLQIYAPGVQLVKFNSDTQNFTRQGDYIQLCLGTC